MKLFQIHNTERGTNATRVYKRRVTPHGTYPTKWETRICWATRKTARGRMFTTRYAASKAIIEACLAEPTLLNKTCIKEYDVVFAKDVATIDTMSNSQIRQLLPHIDPRDIVRLKAAGRLTDLDNLTPV